MPDQFHTVDKFNPFNDNAAAQQTHNKTRIVPVPLIVVHHRRRSDLVSPVQAGTETVDELACWVIIVFLTFDRDGRGETAEPRSVTF